jgi:hypothetical protein
MDSSGPIPIVTAPRTPARSRFRLLLAGPLWLIGAIGIWHGILFLPIPAYLRLEARAADTAAVVKVSKDGAAALEKTERDAWQAGRKATDAKAADTGKEAAAPPGPPASPELARLRKELQEHQREAKEAADALEGFLATRRLPAYLHGEAPGFAPAARAAGSAGGLAFVAWLTLAVSVFCVIAGTLARFRNPLPLRLVLWAAWSVFGWFAVYALAVFGVVGTLADAGVDVGGFAPDAVNTFFWKYNLLWPAALVALLAVFVQVHSRRARAFADAGLPVPGEGEAPGDRVLESLRTHGRDPGFRKSQYASWLSHLAVLVIIPWLLQLVGCVKDYRVPKGSGDPAVLMVQVKPVKKEKKKRITLRPDSAISFQMPDLDDSKMMQEVVEATELKYKVDLAARAGRMGAGGGKKGGWPDGMENALVRFIRLDHGGAGWDDGMSSVHRADQNFLEEFHKLTGFKVSNKPEAHPIRLLARYRKGFAPPFVYLTGDGNIGASGSDVQVLRNYLLGGGLLFADAGSRRFHDSFRGLMQQVFPGQPLRVIADDDPLFQFPFSFPNGAPPLWHHGGMRAMGIKHRDRWVVFYHPGDINDAWKTGHSGIQPDLAEGAYHMGVNIVYYAFTHYLEETKQYRK